MVCYWRYIGHHRIRSLSSASRKPIVVDRYLAALLLTVWTSSTIKMVIKGHENGCKLGGKMKKEAKENFSIVTDYFHAVCPNLY